jgi:hypothetical protein
VELFIRTKRKHENWLSYHLVYEWEDIISETLGIKFVYESAFFNYINLLQRKLKFGFFSLLKEKKYQLFFNIAAGIRSDNYNCPSIIPVIIDFFLPKDKLKNFVEAYNCNPFILISSLEVIKFLDKNKCPLKYYHYPLSLSDKYRITADTYFDKKYDLVLMGRQHPILEAWLNRYVEKYPDFYYVHRVLRGNKSFYYTNRNEYIGNVDKREDYISLLRQSKIGFYSTPGMDSSRITNGFNPVTPRFLELISCGCHIIARYPKNVDTEFYQISEFSPNIDTYEQFEEQMQRALSTDIDRRKYTSYLEKHYTSTRTSLLRNILKNNSMI